MKKFLNNIINQIKWYICPFEICDQCGLEITGGEVDTCICDTLSPCCGVEFDSDYRICPRCHEHI